MYGVRADEIYRLTLQVDGIPGQVDSANEILEVTDGTAHLALCLFVRCFCYRKRAWGFVRELDEHLYSCVNAREVNC